MCRVLPTWRNRRSPNSIAEKMYFKLPCEKELQIDRHRLRSQDDSTRVGIADARRSEAADSASIRLHSKAPRSPVLLFH